MNSFWEIYVADMLASKRFYMEVIGLDLVREQDDFIVLAKGNSKLHICPAADLPEYLIGSQFKRIGSNIEFCFEVENIHSHFERAERSGWQLHERLQKQPWGKTDYRVIDPDGAYIRITSPRHSENKNLKI